jgi:hypothetical protein
VEVAVEARGVASEEEDGFVGRGEVMREVLSACEFAAAQAELAAEHGGGVSS